MSKKIVCLDTQILIWGIKGEAKPNQLNLVAKAKNFIDWLAGQKLTVIIPSVVLSEVLVKVPKKDHNKIISKITKRFKIIPFETIAAQKHAYYWLDKKGVIPNRTELKFDYMIIATALAQKAACIYSHDKGLKDCAEGMIQVKEMPTIMKQGEFS